MNDILETKRIAALKKEISFFEADPLAKVVKEELTFAEDTAPRLLERDHMPSSMATDLLCASEKMSGPFRRQCQRARENHYVSVQTREANIYKIARRFSRSTLMQLDKWLRRALQRRKDLNAVLRSKEIAKKPEQVRAALVTLLEARVESCTQAIDTLMTEIKSRYEVNTTR